ncbi:sensor histidine kinase [Roseiflexus castenholzii]|uniref:sensor histidine kinase n=1 Tax=Roseiflexus castenholzii TaxID=120962 RepID=UPI0002F5903B|nr:ATP-binding protein [Roseiflexus castenholzii]
MSGTRLPPNPWLADHVIFFTSRWMVWGATLLWVLAQGLLDATQLWALCLALLVNMLATRFAQSYLRIVRRNPATLMIDIVYGVALVLFSGGWDSAFLLCASSSLVLPALMYGWRGGIMAGLTFVSIDLAALWAAGAPPADRLLTGEVSGMTLALTMMAPPLFGALVHPLVEMMRDYVEHRRAPSRRSPERSDMRPRRSAPPDAPSLPRESGGVRSISRDASEPSPVAQATRIRTAEHGADELRRLLFAPLAATDVELGTAIDILTSRFSQHTGIAVRVTQLGRARHVRHAQRQLLVRLAQEALLNVQQHAHASSVNVTLRYDSSSVVLMIQDDGIGLLDGTYERPGWRSLRTLQYRLAEHDGRLDVFELDGGGVTVRVSLPLD